MPGIADKFGKASIPTDTSVATTVKTTRLPGVLVLEAFDLSKYAIDTPVFVVTYKKTVDPLTGAVTITSLTSWKALVNPGANTLTNLTVQPGYTDTGNAVGDFIECIPTSAWENSLIDGILTSLNPDGTLKTSAVQTALNLGGGSLNGWNVLGYVPNTIVDNGNRNYTVTILGVDKTDVLSPRTRLLGVRSVTAPTYMPQFNGTTHYLTKVAPTGALSTVTNNFTIMGHFMPTSYSTSNAYMAARADASVANGLGMFMDNGGRVGLYVGNGGASNYRLVYTTTSLPLGRKTHVAATWAAGVVVVYFDGVPQPMMTAAVSGTAPTVAGTGGDWSIGRLGASGGTSFYPGYASGVGVFDAVLSAATIRSYKNQVLSGAEANCIGAWALNNSLADQNAAGNTLTNPAAASFVSGVSPYATNGFNISTGDKDFGIVMTSTFTGGNTVLNVHVAEGCTFTTTGSLSSLQYSYAGAPYGFPGEKYKWRLPVFHAQGAGGAVATGATIWLRSQMFIPIGTWDVGYEVEMTQTTSGAAVHNVIYGLSTTSGVNPDRKDGLTTNGTIVNINEYYPTLSRTATIVLAAAATYYFNAQPIGTSFTGLGIRADLSSIFYADNGYL